MVRPGDDHLVAPAVVLIADAVVVGRVARIMVNGVVEPVARVVDDVAVAEREPVEDAPLGAQELERAQRDRVARLIDEELDRERLPAVRIGDIGVAREIGEERLVDGRVHQVAVVVDLVRPVAEPVGDDRPRDAVADRRGRIAHLVDVVGVKAEAGHGRIDQRDDVIGTHGVEEAVTQHPAGGVRDRFLAGGLDVLRACTLVMEDLVGNVVVGGPRVPHRRGDVIEVPRVHRRAGLVVADSLEEDFLPLAGDRLGRATRGDGRERSIGGHGAVDEVAAAVVGDRVKGLSRRRRGGGNSNDRARENRGAERTSTWHDRSPRSFSGPADWRRTALGGVHPQFPATVSVMRAGSRSMNFFSLPVNPGVQSGKPGQSVAWRPPNVPDPARGRRGWARCLPGVRRGASVAAQRAAVRPANAPPAFRPEFRQVPGRVSNRP